MISLLNVRDEMEIKKKGFLIVNQEKLNFQKNQYINIQLIFNRKKNTKIK
jgi:hypothetical protein